MIIAAPGKAILVGEYAVLEGATAISTAVDRFVRVTVGAGSASGPFVDAARRVVARHLGRTVDVPLTIDSSALYVGQRKLGLGSSAAVTVATVVALLEAAGAPRPERAALFALIDAAHQEAQVELGSGVDVATAIAGGVVRFRRQPLAIESMTLPSSLRLGFVDVGQSASTPQLVAAVRRWQAQDRAGFAAVIDELGRAAQAFAAAGDASGAIAAARSAFAGMAELGRRADAPIVIPAFDKLAAIAAAHGAASKPSGAGGGDLAVLFSDGDEATAALHTAVRSAGFSLLELGAGAPGVTKISEATTVEQS